MKYLMRLKNAINFVSVSEFDEIPGIALEGKITRKKNKDIIVTDVKMKNTVATQ